jgi:Ca2+-binding EF-hand superfamily protein
MGNKGSTDASGGCIIRCLPDAASGKQSKVPDKPATKLTDKDIKFFMDKTDLTKAEITDLFAKFNNNNPDGKMDRAEFMKLYTSLRKEPPANLV